MTYGDNASRRRSALPLFAAAIATAFAAIALAAAAPAPAQAATPKVQDFALGTSIDGYDWTGDGKADTLATEYLADYSWQAGQGEFSGVAIYLNGKRAYTLRDTLGYRSGSAGLSSRIQRVQLPGKKVLAALVTSFENGDGTCTFLQASGSKLKKVGNPLKGFSKFGTHNSAYVKSVSGKTLKIAYSSMSYSLGGVTFTLKAKYKGGKVRPSQTTCTPKLRRSLKRTWTLWQSKKLYGSATGKKAKATLAKGTKTKVSKLFLSKNHKANAVKVRAGKKTGWLKGYTKAHYKMSKAARYGSYNGLFSQVVYAG